MKKFCDFRRHQRSKSPDGIPKLVQFAVTYNNEDQSTAHGEICAAVMEFPPTLDLLKSNNIFACDSSNESLC